MRKDENDIKGFIFLARLYVSQGRKFTHNILGFGGAFTDAAGHNLRKLPKSMQDEIMRLVTYYVADDRSKVNYLQ